MENRSFCFCGHSVRAIAFLRPLSRFGNGQMVLVECFGEGLSTQLSHFVMPLTPRLQAIRQEAKNADGSVELSFSQVRIC